METFELAVEPRTTVGKSVRRIRADGFIPVVIYGLASEPQVGQVPAGSFEKLYTKAGESSVVNAQINGQTVPTIIHSVDRHPVRDTIIHVDLLRIDLQKEIEATVPLKQVGTAPAIKEFGGVVVTVRDTVHIRCLPKDLVHAVEVDLSGLTKIGDTLHMKDVPAPAGITILDSADVMIVSMAAPRAEEEAKPVAAATPVEGAPAGEVPKEGEAAAGAEVGKGAEATEGADKSAKK